MGWVPVPQEVAVGSEGEPVSQLFYLGLALARTRLISSSLS